MSVGESRGDDSTYISLRERVRYRFRPALFLTPSIQQPRATRYACRRELVGNFDTSECNYRDVFVAGNCDDGVRTFCEAVGWGGDLKEAYENTEIRKRARTEEVD